MELTYYCDLQRHLVCKPYSKENLHLMAEDLGIKRCWFHKNHYDIPKRRIVEIMSKCNIVEPRKIVMIINEQKIKDYEYGLAIAMNELKNSME